MSLEARESSHERRHHHPTRMSPALRADLVRMRGLAPYLGVLAVIAIVLALGYYAAGILIAPQEAWSRPFGTAARFGLSPKTVSFSSRDGVALKAWWERPWTVVEPKGTVILVHGLQMNKTGMAYTGGKLLARGYNVLLPDLRGHGESAGFYSTSGHVEKLDVLAAIDWVHRRDPSSPITLLGYSSGAVASLYAAAESPYVSAVIADSAFLNMDDVLDREEEFVRNPPPGAAVTFSHRAKLWLFTAPGMSTVGRWMYRVRTGVPLQLPQEDLLAAVAKIRMPRVLYMRADQDPVVPAQVTQRLLDATGATDKRIVSNRGRFHSAIAGNPLVYLDSVTGFLAGH